MRTRMRNCVSEEYGNKCDAFHKINADCPFVDIKSEYSMNEIAFTSQEEFKLIENTYYLPTTSSKQDIPSFSLLLVNEGVLTNRLIGAKRRVANEKGILYPTIDLKTVKPQLARSHRLLYETRRGESNAGKNYKNYSFDFPAYNPADGYKIRALAFVLSREEYLLWAAKSSHSAPTDEEIAGIDDEVVKDWYDQLNYFLRVIKRFGSFI